MIDLGNSFYFYFYLWNNCFLNFSEEVRGLDNVYKLVIPQNIRDEL